MTADFPVTLFHNPACGTSRKVLDALRDRGHAPEVVEYLKAGWTPDRLGALFAAMGAAPRDLLRVKTAETEAPELLADGVSDATILAAMIDKPVLVERPIVVTPKGTVLARPAERLDEVL